MAGFSNITGDESIMFADNASFDGTERGGKLTTNGQLWIGSTASPHVKVGTITSPDASVTIGYSSPNITLQVTGGSTVVQTLTPNEDFDGTAATPVAPQGGTINALGSNPSLATVTETYNSTGAATGNFLIEHRAWTTRFVVDSSTTPGTRGTFSTIQAAVTAAAGVTNGTIYIRPGTYTENITLSDGITLIGSTTDAVSFGVTGAPVKIKGKVSYTGAARVNFLNIWFETNGDYAISTTTGFFDFTDCSFFGVDHDVFQGNGGGDFQLFNCCGQLGAGFAYFIMTAASVRIFGGFYGKAGTQNSTFATSGILEIHDCYFQEYSTFTNATAFTATNCQIGSGSSNTVLTYGGSSGAEIYNCSLSSGTAAAISVSGSLTIGSSVIKSSNSTAVITGAGTLIYSGISFASTGNIINVTTQTPRVSVNDAKQVTTPGAYPYTTIPQDYLIKVDTSSARTITPYASPITGQIHVIKDTVGSAGANNITITPSGKNIDGAASYTININYGSVTIIYNGTEWSVV